MISSCFPSVNTGILFAASCRGTVGRFAGVGLVADRLRVLGERVAGVLEVVVVVTNGSSLGFIVVDDPACTAVLPPELEAD